MQSWAMSSRTTWEKLLKEFVSLIKKWCHEKRIWHKSLVNLSLLLASRDYLSQAPSNYFV